MILRFTRIGRSNGSVLPTFKLFQLRAIKLLRLVPIQESVLILGPIPSEESQPILAIWQMDRDPVR